MTIASRISTTLDSSSLHSSLLPETISGAAVEDSAIEIPWQDNPQQARIAIDVRDLAARLLREAPDESADLAWRVHQLQPKPLMSPDETPPADRASLARIVKLRGRLGRTPPLDKTVYTCPNIRYFLKKRSGADLQPTGESSG
ncbi:MAG: hypothetical protein ABIG68_01120 [Acidobacteriota bacterium]